MSLQILTGAWLAVSPQIPDKSINTCVTSPPYYGLRSYGTNPQIWGGSPDCPHEWGKYTRSGVSGGTTSKMVQIKGRDNFQIVPPQEQAFCEKCGAWCGELGAEPTPELYVEHMVACMREVRRVLRDDGTLWLNIGDSYYNYRPGKGQALPKQTVSKTNQDLPQICARRGNKLEGLKEKDLIGIPWALAKALRDPYYTGKIRAERDRVWMAAIIDGEGTICASHHTRKDDGRPRTMVQICVTNTSTLMLDEAQRIWQASQSEHQRHGEGHLGQLDSYRWIIHGVENKSLFLREIYPYLVVKRKQAVIAYNLLLLMADAKRLGHSPQRDSVRAKRALLASLISDANKQKPCDVPSWCIEPPSVLEDGWILRSEIIWHKPNPMPESVTDRPTKSHEQIFLLAKSARYYYNHEAVAEEAASAGAVVTLGERSFAKRQADGAGGARSGNALATTYTVRETRNRRSVWTVPTKPYKGAHFAAFPPELIVPCVLAGAPEGGVVLDPFGGSGTTAQVARSLGRRAVVVELNPEYVKLIEERSQKPLRLSRKEKAALTGVRPAKTRPEAKSGPPRPASWGGKTYKFRAPERQMSLPGAEGGEG